MEIKIRIPETEIAITEDEFNFKMSPHKILTRTSGKSQWTFEVSHAKINRWWKRKFYLNF